MWFCGSSPITWGQQEEEEEDRDEHDSTQSTPTVWDENEQADDEHDARSPPTMWDEEEKDDDEHDTQSPPTTWDETEEADDESPPTMWGENEETDDEHGHDDDDVPSGSSEEGEPKFIEDKYRYSTVDEVITVLREAGLGSSNLIFGIDFTKSNDWSGKHSFGGESLHAISRTPNPYEQAISIIGRTLSPFDDDNLIPCFGFGDVSTCDHSVFNFYEEDRPCRGFEEVLDRYKQMIPYLDFSGPTSFAPLIYAAISVVERSNFQYHVLVIIADGQAATSKSYSILSPQEEETIQALVDASFYPLSIVMVGVGDGPWDEMKHVDDCIPDRAFHNFQFVNFTDIMSTSKDMEKKEAALAFAALMEIPAQYKATQCLQPPEWHEEMADPWMILPPPIEVLERDYAVAVSHFPAAPALSTGIGKDSSDEQVCPICLMNPKDMAFQCGHLLSLPSAALTGVGKGTSDEQLCPICLTNPKDMAFQCGHLTCKECGPTLSTCHLCRAPITVRLRLFS
ncbi:E3 ubiquitin-protein ligase RGLG3-like isoform X6 [Hordeum vulgare subsp. vulgare]|uniref:E3 ubiquitin-protein ligase RGLG3-like isoform X6 n=1 Tax=Hordeum vulgare subsp. vulgare TaxID=112509 RepID=UPI001D1A5673|nr:E3 ubiquitin-protein ligase RGLG3-like isoform X6 [Hordeum vulgare subsp. vulgare]